jgi:choline dehydrogenase-like flavoprotein
VRLASSDPLAHPLIDPNYWSDPHDRAMSLEGLRIAREILAQKALKPFILAERHPGPGVTSEADIAAYAYRTCKTDHHPCGACKMGTDAMAVVDPKLKVRGVDGLRIVDASIMPTLVRAPINPTVLMMAEKIAALMRQGA